MPNLLKCLFKAALNKIRNSCFDEVSFLLRTVKNYSLTQSNVAWRRESEREREMQRELVDFIAKKWEDKYTQIDCKTRRMLLSHSSLFIYFILFFIIKWKGEKSI